MLGKNILFTNWIPLSERQCHLYFWKRAECDSRFRRDSCRPYCHLMQGPPAYHVASENACRDRLSDGSSSDTRHTHRVSGRCGCVRGFSVRRIDGIACRTYCSRIVVRRDESADADSKRFRWEMSCYTRCIGMVCFWQRNGNQLISHSLRVEWIERWLTVRPCDISVCDRWGRDELWNDDCNRHSCTQMVWYLPRNAKSRWYSKFGPTLPREPFLPLWNLKCWYKWLDCV